MSNKIWDVRKYHGRYNKYPFTEVVSFVMRNYGGAQDRKVVRILDLGCGGAHHLMFLAQEGFDYYGLDGSEESVDIATARLTGAGFSADTVRLGVFDKLPYEPDFFDCVIDRGSITCNRKADILPILGEVHRVLRPGGKFFSAMLHEKSTSKDGAKNLGDGDYTDFAGRLSEAGVLHFTNVQEVMRLYSIFQIEDVELVSRESVLEESGNDDVTAWMIVTCKK